MEYTIQKNGEIKKNDETVLTYEVETDRKICLYREGEVFVTIFHDAKSGNADIVTGRGFSELPRALQECVRDQPSGYNRGKEGPLEGFDNAAAAMRFVAEHVPANGTIGKPSNPERYRKIGIEELAEYHALNEKNARALYEFLVEEDDMSEHAALAKLDSELGAGKTLEDIAEPYL